MKERWVNIAGYEGHYMVSDHGRVKSLCRKVNHRGRQITLPEKIKVLQMGTTGYYVLRLSLNTNDKNCKVHQLVAKAFISNEHNHPFINHKDGNKLNNHYSNLEWCTPLHNNLHALRMGLKVMRSGVDVNTVVLTPEQVKQIRASKGLLAERVIAKIYNCSKGAIHGILSGKTWKSLK